MNETSSVALVRKISKAYRYTADAAKTTTTGRICNCCGTTVIKDSKPLESIYGQQPSYWIGRPMISILFDSDIEKVKKELYPKPDDAAEHFTINDPDDGEVHLLWVNR